jgi:trk system potassium uptake protein TrkH
MATIVCICALVLAGYAFALLAPFGVAIITENLRLVEGIGLFALGYILFAALLFFAFKGRTKRLDRGGMFIMTCAVWLTLVLAAMVALVALERLPLAIAFFDAASAATALGNTFSDGYALATPMKAFRAITAWYGGFITLCLIVYVMSPFRVGGLPNRDLRFVLHGSGQGDPRIAETVLEIAAPYIILTGTCFLLLIGFGARPHDAFLASTAALSTNGFVPTLSGGSIFNNTSAELVYLVFMIIGGTSIIWHKMIVTRRFNLAVSEHRESMAAVGLIISVGMALALYFVWVRQSSPAILPYIFDVASTMTTSGVVYNSSVGNTVPLLLAMMLALGGATTFSTSGGIKLFRLGVMLSTSIAEARHLILPNAILIGRLGTTARQSATIKAVWSYFFLFIVTVCAGLIGFALIGLDFDVAFASAVGSLSSVASLIDSTKFETEYGAAYASWAAVLSIAGKVEFLVVLAALAKLQQR